MISYMLMLDTSFVIAYFNTRDQNHRLATKIAKTITAQKWNSTSPIMSLGNSHNQLSKAQRPQKSTKHRQTNSRISQCRKYKDVFADAWKIFSGQKLHPSFEDCHHCKCQISKYKKLLPLITIFKSRGSKYSTSDFCRY